MAFAVPNSDSCCSVTAAVVVVVVVAVDTPDTAIDYSTDPP